MEIIKPSFFILAMTGHPKNPFSYVDSRDKLIEAAGRTCYKSETAITEESAAKFINDRIKTGHLTVIEHSWEARAYRMNGRFPLAGDWSKFLNISKNLYYSNPATVAELIIVGNLRAWKEAEEQNNWLLQQPYRKLSEEEVRAFAIENREPSLLFATVRLINDRGVSHETVRHRPPTFSQESTRYVNYNKKGARFILPPWVQRSNFSFLALFKKSRRADLIWYIACWLSWKFYNMLLKHGWEPQKARNVLPISLKTEMVVTGTLAEWQHIFRLRALGLTGKPHPQMEEIMIPLKEYFEKAEPVFFNERVLDLR